MIYAPDKALCRTLVVKADAAQLAEVRRFVEDVGRELGLESEQLFDLKVAVSEACANAVEHAGREEVPLEVCAQTDAQRLTFTISDTGTFRPPAPVRQSYANRGLGLPLMVALMDEVSFTRTPGGGTTVSLSVLLDRHNSTSVT